MIEQQLRETGDFLTITRAHEWHLDPFSFHTKDRCQVSIWDTGVICIEPEEDLKKDIVLSCAVHGNETAPIEIVSELVQKAILGEIKLKQRVLFIFGNPASINIGQRFVEENMNRLFSGQHSEGPGLNNSERERAKKLEGYVARFFESVPKGRYRCHYDLHTAIRGSKNEKFAVYPFLHGKPWKKSQFEFMGACGVNTILLMKAPATTFSYFSSNSFGADSFTVELGKVRPFGENDMSRFVQVKQTLTQLIGESSIQAKPFDAQDFEIFEVYRTINKETEDFRLNFADDVDNFTGYSKGFVLAEDGDIQHIAEVDGEAIIFPNANVAIGQRALLTVIPTQVSEHLE
ncbi:succinylglutamate desuccinylase [Algicola sagamiensis]|uniref:succinylglutamate desuccinylase n=1 Tax=Algicola sagamiensis TaxID=163869 RepID=UPI00036C12BA|nr:succinylglutamate desuccinylase [Algicola sagamiensis]